MTSSKRKMATTATATTSARATSKPQPGSKRLLLSDDDLISAKFANSLRAKKLYLRRVAKNGATLETTVLTVLYLFLRMNSNETPRVNTES